METLKSITSTKNEYIRYLRSLKNKKSRDEAGEFICEGEKCVREALSGGWEISALLLNAVVYGEYTAKYGDKCINVSENIIDALSDSKSPQGILAVVKKKSFDPVYTGLTVVLEDVSDPTNVGSIIRSADAMDSSCVIMSPGCADIFGQRAVRASMGSLFHIPVLYTDIESYLTEFKKNGSIICGHLQGEGSFIAADNMCIVVGNEARGITEKTAKLCDSKFKIPMPGRAESLNVGVAAGIMLYEASKNMKGHV